MTERGEGKIRFVFCLLNMFCFGVCVLYLYNGSVYILSFVFLGLFLRAGSCFFICIKVLDGIVVVLLGCDRLSDNRLYIRGRDKEFLRFERLF